MQTSPIALFVNAGDSAAGRDSRRSTADRPAERDAAFADMLSADAAKPSTKRGVAVDDGERTHDAKRREVTDVADEAEDEPAAPEEEALAEANAQPLNGGFVSAPDALVSQATPAPDAARSAVPPATEPASVMSGAVATAATPERAGPATNTPIIGPKLSSAHGAAVAPDRPELSAAPPSQQAADLAKVLASGTRVQVSRTDAGPGAAVPPLAGETIAALAAGEGIQPLATGKRTGSLAGSTAQAKAVAGGSDALVPTGASAVLVSEPGMGIKGRGTSAANSGALAEPGLGAANGSAMTAAVPGGAAGATPAAANPALSPSAAASPPAAATTANAETAAASPKQEQAGPGPGAVQAADGQAAAAPSPPAAPQTALAGSNRAAAGEAPPPPAAGQISVHIAKGVQAGLDRIEIQLAPASLGRVDIRLEFTDHHQVKVAVSADSSDTLDALRTDSRLLERALHDAGLKTDTGSLSFNLREQGARSGSGGHHGHGGDGRPAGPQAAAGRAEAEPTPPLSSLIRRSGGIDIRA